MESCSPPNRRAELHHLLEPLVLVDEIRLAQVAERLVHEHAGQVRVADDGVLAGLDRFRGEEFHGLARGLLAFLLEVAADLEPAQVADAVAAGLDVRAFHRDGAERHAAERHFLLDRRALGVHEDHRAGRIHVARGGGLDFRRGGAQDFVVAPAERLLLGERDLAPGPPSARRRNGRTAAAPARGARCRRRSAGPGRAPSARSAACRRCR